ncbi:MAG: HDIG domain-containing protein [Candidatus Obscuribacterales bacterium]
MGEIFLWVSVVVVSFIAVIFSLSAPHLFGLPLKPGTIAPFDLVSTGKVEVVDEKLTHEQQDQTRQHTLPVFEHSAQRDDQMLERLRKEVDLVKQEQTQPGSVKLDDQLELSSIKMLARDLKPAELGPWSSELQSATKRFLGSATIYPGSHTQRLANNFAEFLPEKWSPAVRKESSALVATKVLDANIVINDEATRAKIDKALSEAKPVTKEVAAGTVIAKRGEPITPVQFEVLSKLGITKVQDWSTIAGIAAALLAAFGLFGVYLHTFEQKWFFSPSAIGLMSTVCVVTCGIATFAGQQYPQFIPLPAAALVLSVIFGRRLALILTTLLIIFLSLGDVIEGPHLVALTAASAMALANKINKRKDLMVAGFLIGLVQAIGYFTAVILGKMPDTPINFGSELALQVLGGLSSAIVAMGSLPFLESLFGMLTPFRIAELTAADHPLLRQLEENAPGTYQHSLAVANLAEAGARSIGCNVNLVRAGAIYHDIGKMVTPRFFIENQLGDKNPHDFIPPEESRARVLAHVTNGLELAQKYGLPDQVQAFIPEHQGTTIMAYFYHKACMRDGKDKVDEMDYRYPGPKPQTRESAIVMLADVSEAVTHSMKDPSQEEVEQAMANVFKARWDDGQFNESSLTHDELDKVRKAFVRVWRTLHHDRLKYPSTTTGRMPVPPPPAAENQESSGKQRISGGRQAISGGQQAVSGGQKVTPSPSAQAKDESPEVVSQDSAAQSESSNGGGQPQTATNADIIDGLVHPPDGCCG